MKLTFDCETRSAIDLRTHGAYIYAGHDSTEIICFALSMSDIYTDNPLYSQDFIWVAPQFRYLDFYEEEDGKFQENVEFISDEDFKSLLDEADEIEAHNASFEAIMWKEVMVRKHGFPSLPKDKLRCSAAKAAVHAIPRSLEKACLAMNVNEQKDTEGRKIMLKMCKPRKPRKLEREENENWQNILYWHEDEKDFYKLMKYCLQDVKSEKALSHALDDLSPFETEVWKLDQKINNLGVVVDVPSVEILMRRVEQQESEWLKEALKLTGGKCTPRQVTATIGWLSHHNIFVNDLQKRSVKDLLKEPLPDNIRRVLEIRQTLGKSSISKLKAMKKMSNNHNRVKGLFLYSGARTKRWTGKGIQPQNLPRDSYGDKEIEEVLSFNKVKRELIYGDDMEIASKCIRGMFIAAPKHDLLCADFSAIEGRVLAWIAGEERVLVEYRQGLEAYKTNASKIYNVRYDDVTKDQRFIGKIAELSLGYQGGVGAFMGMLDNYGVKDLDEDEVKLIIKKWRGARPKTVQLWYGLEEAAIKAVKTGDPYKYRNIVYRMNGNFLECVLPSGGKIRYAYPSIELMDTPYMNDKETLVFWGVGSDKDKMLAGKKDWGKISTYGGKLCENVVQACARDLLAEAMLRVDRMSFRIVMHVHDEIVCEQREQDFRDLDLFKTLINTVPKWAKGLPIECDAWRGKRYRK
jgi:DNA polymerase bacteriophage-type